MNIEPKQIVTYCRVSTRRQGVSGLGLDAQKAICTQFTEQYGYSIVSEYQEVESGKGSEALVLRPELARALAHAKKLKVPLLIAKLDRLSRDVAFISGLMSQQIRFIAADVGPECEAFHIHILAAFGERERAEISRRTKAALAAKRERGEVLGNLASLPEAQEADRRTQQRRSKQFVENVIPIIRDIKRSGIHSYSGLAKSLNSRGIQSPRGGTWYPETIKRVMSRHLQLHPTRCSLEF